MIFDQNFIFCEKISFFGQHFQPWALKFPKVAIFIIKSPHMWPPSWTFFIILIFFGRVEERRVSIIQILQLRKEGVNDSI